MFISILDSSVLVLIVTIKTLLFSPFVMNGQSMEPNYHDGQYLITEKLTKNFDR